MPGATWWWRIYASCGAKSAEAHRDAPPTDVSRLAAVLLLIDPLFKAKVFPIVIVDVNKCFCFENPRFLYLNFWPNPCYNGFTGSLLLEMAGGTPR